MMKPRISLFGTAVASTSLWWLLCSASQIAAAASVALEDSTTTSLDSTHAANTSPLALFPIDESRSLSYYGHPSKVQRIECTTSSPDSFSSWIALAVHEKEPLEGDALAHRLRDVHRAGTALECDPYQRALQDATFLQSKTSVESDQVDIALFQVNVQSTGNTPLETALEPPQANLVATDKHATGDVCLLSSIVDNEASNSDSHEDCPRYGCYCPADLLDQDETTGVTEQGLVDLFGLDLSPPPATKMPKSSKKEDRRRLSGKKEGSYGKGSSKKGAFHPSSPSYSKKSSGKKSVVPHGVMDAAELNQFDCPGVDNFATTFLFALSIDPCTQLTRPELEEFLTRLVREYNLFQYQNCDPEFRRITNFEIPTCEAVPVVENDDARRLGLGGNFLFTLPLEYQGGTNGRAVDTGTGDFRKRHLVATEDDPRQLSWDFQTDVIDYGVLNGNDVCYCSAFYPGGGTGRGINEQEFQALSDAILKDVTNGRALVAGVAEVDSQECGPARIFTQRVSVIANGDDDAVGNDLGVVIGELLNDLSLSKCVKSYFQILDVNLVFQEKKYDKYTGKDAWALQFDFQYVAFGVMGDDADLFKAVKFDYRYKYKRGYGTKHARWLANVEDTSQGDSLEWLSESAQRKLEEILLSVTCVCDKDIDKQLDMLPLLLVNRLLDQDICDAEDPAAPGVSFALIVH